MLENPRSPRVRAVAKLTKRSARTETGLYLLEGPQAVREALTYSPEAIVELFATPAGWDRHPDIRAKAADAAVEVEYVTEYVLNAMADTVTPQGIVAVARQAPTSVRDVFAASPRLVAICEEVRDPGNLGTIIRAADAAGRAGDLHLQRDRLPLGRRRHRERADPPSAGVEPDPPAPPRAGARADRSVRRSRRHPVDGTSD